MYGLLWVATGAVFGHAASWSGVAVFFDSFDNSGAARRTYPYVSVVTNDGSDQYVHDNTGTHAVRSSVHGERGVDQPGCSCRT